MKKRGLILYLVVMMIMAILLAACGKKEAKTLKLTLDENPTTGYTWFYDIQNPDIVKNVVDNYKSKDTGRAGSGGIHEYEFSGVKPGETTITFTLKRDWEGGGTAEVKEYNVTVDQDKTVKAVLK